MLLTWTKIHYEDSNKLDFEAESSKPSNAFAKLYISLLCFYES